MKTNVASSLSIAIVTSAFLTLLFSGNIFAQQKLVAEKQIIPSLPQIEAYNFKNPKPLANGCDTVNYSKAFGPSKVWSAFIWTAGTPQSGMVHGTNSLGDKEKGNYIDLATFSTATHITGTYIWFKKVHSGTPSKTVTVKVYDNSGVGGSPGAVLGSKTLTMSEIMADDAASYLTTVIFPSPIAIPGNKKVFVTCDYSGLSWTGTAGTDSLGIIASDSLQEIPGLVWEKTSADAWHALDDLTTWDMRRQALFILPFVTNNIAAPTATVAVTPANAVVCANTPIYFDATGSTNTYGEGWWANPNSGYSSASINGQNLTLTYTLASTYVVGFNSYGCGAVATASVLVTVNPSPTLTASSNSPVCQGASLQFSATSNASSYSWIGPNGYTSASQNPTINPASTSNNGTYAVTVTNSSSCTNTQLVNVTVNPCTGIDKIESLDGMMIVQNEEQQYFLILNNGAKGVKLSIFNIAGALMSAETVEVTGKTELNTSSLNSGMYFVQVSSSDRTWTQKIVITR